MKGARSWRKRREEAARDVAGERRAVGESSSRSRSMDSVEEDGVVNVEEVMRLPMR